MKKIFRNILNLLLVDTFMCGCIFISCPKDIKICAVWVRLEADNFFAISETCKKFSRIVLGKGFLSVGSLKAILLEFELW